MLKTTSARSKINTNFDTKYHEGSGFIKFGIAFWIQRVRFLIHSIFLLLAQYLTDASCFTVYLKKEKQPDKDIITYNLTEPVTPHQYNSPSKYDIPKYTIQDNCPSILNIPKIERSNDNKGWTLKLS